MGQFIWEEDEQDTEIVFGILNIEFYPLNCLSRLPSSVVSYSSTFSSISRPLRRSFPPVTAVSSK
jgi:hypothetical protein